MSFTVNPTDFPAYKITTATPPTKGPSPTPLTPPTANSLNIFHPRSFTHPIPPSRLLPHTLRRAMQTPNFSLPATPKQYTRLLPALHLATNLLTHSLPILHTIRNAPLTHTLLKGKRKDHLQRPLQPFSSAQKTHISTQLASLAPRIRYLIAFPAAMLAASADTIPLRAVAGPASPHRSAAPARQTAGEDAFHYVTSLPAELLELLGSDDWDVELDPGARCRVLFHLAVTLVHELVHALFWERERERLADEAADVDRKEKVSVNTEEPYFRPEDAQRELGEAWERWFFGGVLEMPFDGDFASAAARGVSIGREAGVGVRVPTYALRWRGWVERGVFERLAPWDEDERWLLQSCGVEEFFDEERWYRFSGMVEYGDAWVAVCEAGGGPFQLSFAPLRTGNTVLMDRGPEDNRSVEQRRRSDQLFDMLLERCAAGEFSCLPGGG